MGLSWHYLMYAAGILVWGLLFHECKKRGSVVLFKGIDSVMLLCFYLCVLMSCFWAADTGEALAGGLRWLSALGFLLLLMQRKADSETLDPFAYLPIAGCLMLILCTIGYFIPAVQSTLFFNGRLSGFFNYPNTCGLFFMLAIMKLTQQTDGLKKQFYYLQMALLLAGFALTGSRTGLVLLLFYLIVKAIFLFVNRLLNKEESVIKFGDITLAIGGVLLLVIVLLYVVITRDVYGFGRLFRLSLSEKDLVERVLFWRDALPILKDHNLGVGYGGYAVLRPLYQSGAYVTRFVHNDWLQIAIDHGLIAGILFAVLIIRALVNKEDGGNKSLLCLLAAHLFFDFDLQFGCVMLWLIALLSLSGGKRIEIRLKKEKAGVLSSVLCIACICLLAYFGTANLLLRIGNPNGAYAMNPLDAEAADHMMLNSADQRSAAEIADRILTHNAYDKTAWRMKSYDAYETGKYDEMTTAITKRLALEPYNVTAYEDSIELFYAAMQNCLAEGEEQEAKKLREQLLEVNKLRIRKKKNVSQLAVLAKDRPKLKLSEMDREIVKKVKE